MVSFNYVIATVIPKHKIRTYQLEDLQRHWPPSGAARRWAAHFVLASRIGLLVASHSEMRDFCNGGWGMIQQQKSRF